MRNDKIRSLMEFAVVTAVRAASIPNPATHAVWCAEVIAKARRHHTLCEKACNTGGEAVDKAIERLEAKVTKLVIANVAVKAVKFGHDPRGCTVQLVLKSGLSNWWERDAWCVPSR